MCVRKAVLSKILFCGNMQMAEFWVDFPLPSFIFEKSRY